MLVDSIQVHESMDLKMVKGTFAVCKVHEIDSELLKKEYVFIANTDSERSIICPQELVPSDSIVVEYGWECFKIAEDASFSKYGMIAFLSEIIASLKTSILVVGTYDTDYIFIKEERMPEVIDALKENGCRFL